MFILLIKLFFVFFESLFNDSGFVFFYKFIKFLIEIDIYNRHFKSERGYGYINIYVAIIYILHHRNT